MRIIRPQSLALALLLTAATAAPALAQQPATSPPPASAAPGADETVRLPLDFHRYYSYDDMETALRLLEKAYPKLATLRIMGHSYEGRPLWVMEVSNPETGPAESKAAIYIDGNTHGNEVQGTEVCLFTLQHLLSRYERDPFVKRLVDERVFYVAPSVNPDGRVSFFRDPNTAHSSRRNRRPYDNDGDGLVEEDGYEDLDGDGEILGMRRKNPFGAYRDGEEPRLMKPRARDEKGKWERVGSEGIDNDGDGRINEDPPGGVDLNRNFPTNWQPSYIQGGAGDYPLSEPETRATALFILDRPHIAAIQSYHNFGGMILRPPASKDDSGVPREDIAVYDALGRRGERMLPGYRYMQTFEDLYAVHGGFLEWGYLGLGVYTFTNELWNMPQDYDGNKSVSEAERLRWNDEMLGGQGFVPWKSFDHPTLGAVELGGWRKWSRRIPPVWQLEDTCYRNTMFTLYHADAMPKVSLGEPQIEAVPGSPGVWRVSIRCRNERFMPTASGLARRMKVAVGDLVRIQGIGVRALARAVARPPFGVRREAVERGPRPWEIDVGSLPGRGEVEVTWLVSGRGPFRIELISEKGGRVAVEGTIGR